MTTVTTYDMYSKDTIIRLVEQEGGYTAVRHKGKGRHSQGQWTIAIDFSDTLDGLTFMKALRDYDGISYSVLNSNGL